MAEQHKSPCSACPFHRGVQPDALGGSSPEKYVGQVTGPFWLPCHMHSNFADPNWKTDTSKAQCAGAAIFRANVGVIDKMPDALLHLPPDPNKVFASYTEFYAHHKQITVEQAEMILGSLTPNALMMMEYHEAQRKGWMKPVKKGESL